MKVLLFCPKGFEMMEFSVFIDVMGWARNDFNHPIEVHTCGFSKTVYSTFSVPVIMDKVIDDILADEYDALAIPGGFESFGFYEEAYDKRFLELIREFDRMNKPIASVCVGAMPIAKSGILSGRNATTYHLDGGIWQKRLFEFNVNVVDKRIATDGNVITSYCPETVPYVAFELLKMLIGEKDTIRVRIAMGYN